MQLHGAGFFVGNISRILCLIQKILEMLLTVELDNILRALLAQI